MQRLHCQLVMLSLKEMADCLDAGRQNHLTLSPLLQQHTQVLLACFLCFVVIYHYCYLSLVSDILVCIIIVFFILTN